jgi:hypothetical protein
MAPTVAQAWQNYKNVILDEGKPPEVLLVGEMAFFAGAAHVIASIKGMSGANGKPQDLRGLVLWMLHTDKDFAEHIQKIAALAKVKDS